MSVQSRSDNVNTSLFDKREHIEKLHRTCNLLRKVQVSKQLSMSLFIVCLCFHILNAMQVGFLLNGPNNEKLILLVWPLC
jgi:Zn-dependent membrane protease YugP